MSDLEVEIPAGCEIHSAPLSPEELPHGLPARYSQSFPGRVAGEVRARSVLREVIALAEQASALSDPQMRARLAVLAGTARAGCRECRSTNEAPAAHRLRALPAGSRYHHDPALNAGGAVSPGAEQHVTRAGLAARARTAAQGEPATSPQGPDDTPVLMVRYRAGVAGETRRTVHAVPLRPASRSAGAMLTTLCGAILNPAALEVVAFREGMPCIACVFRCVSDTAAQAADR